MLLALDPSVRSPGAALFLDGNLLVAGRVRLTSVSDCSDGERWLAVARDILAWALLHGAYRLKHVETLVFEKPQIYSWSKSKGDPNQLIGLAGVASALYGLLFARHPQIEAPTPTPAEWIGQLPKVCPVCKGKAKKKCLECKGSAWETPRGRFIRSRLTLAELALVPDQNDAIDAVGLGLFALGRLKPRSVFSNGRDGR